MDYLFDHAVAPSLRLRPHHNTCPHCCGVDFKVIDANQHLRAQLCCHCNYEHKKYLQFIYELEDTMRELGKDRAVRKKVA